MSDPTTLDDVLSWPSTDAIKQMLIDKLSDPDFLIDDFESGGGMRTLLELETDVISDLVQQAIPLILSQGFVDSSTGRWLPPIAHGLYAIDPVPGTIAIQTITVTSLGPPFNIGNGKTFFLASDNRRYVATSDQTLAGDDSVTFDVSGESPGAALGLVNRLELPVQGITISGAAVKIVSGVAQYGSNDEPEQSVTQRCLARWPALDAVPDADRLRTWANAASAEVTRMKIDVDSTNAGGVIITIAGVAGQVSDAARSAVQLYIDNHAPITDYITVQNSVTSVITPEGTVTCLAARQAEIAAAADSVWNAYLETDLIGSKVYLGVLIQALMDAGAIDCGIGSSDAAFGGDYWVMAGPLVPAPNPAGLLALLTWVLL